MSTLVYLDVRRRISEKDEGIYIHDFSKGERTKLRKAKSNSWRLKDQFPSISVIFHDKLRPSNLISC